MFQWSSEVLDGDLQNCCELHIIELTLCNMTIWGKSQVPEDSLNMLWL